MRASHFFYPLLIIFGLVGLIGYVVRLGAPSSPAVEPTPATPSGAIGPQPFGPLRRTPFVPAVTPDPVSYTPDREPLADQFPRPGAAVFSAIQKYLRQGHRLIEITRPPVLKLPEPLIRDQLTNYFRLGNIYFALAERNTFNQPRPHGARQAAMLYARSGDQSWQYFFPVEDVGERPDTIENNPLYFWSEGSILQLVITDIQGGGSGEGTAKWLTSADGGKSWRIAKCFYLSLGEFYEPNQRSKPNFAAALRHYLSLSLGYFNEQYRFNTSTGNFEHLQQTDAGQEQIIIVSECHNFRLPE